MPSIHISFVVVDPNIEPERLALLAHNGSQIVDMYLLFEHNVCDVATDHLADSLIKPLADGTHQNVSPKWQS